MFVFVGSMKQLSFNYLAYWAYRAPQESSLKHLSTLDTAQVGPFHRMFVVHGPPVKQLPISQGEAVASQGCTHDMCLPVIAVGDDKH